MTQAPGATDSHTGFQRYLLDWFKTPLGRHALDFERRLLDRHLNHLFGYYLVQMGRISHTSLLAASRIKNQLLVDENSIRADQAPERLVLANLLAQPFATSSLDLVFLPHTLESTLDPYRFIRYVDDLIRADGHIVITGFNPMSCLVLRQRLGQDRAHWREAHIIKLERLVDWLRVLGYEIVAKEYSASRCFKGGVSDRIQPVMAQMARATKPLANLGLSLSQSYILVARKQQWVPIKPKKVVHFSDWVPGVKPAVVQSHQSNLTYEREN
ncbi:methyltransferase domain-containing protein [Thiomicrospira sp. ALE5]|uniref:methyltransferase domain-containing protein n=1 Tax=Thiomicrospira sp. ALE5 TaxID=748650 RepID=UPI0008EACA6E|nr:methyltransferase domain-containing protein [Thiomicrospira sp. ALE5]SFR50589.1 hypothetical protein SAMN03092900_0378 [Thiomicrospira sp. ALE5]